MWLLLMGCQGKRFIIWWVGKGDTSSYQGTNISLEECQMNQEYKPMVQMVNYITLSGVLKSVFKSDDEEKIEERRKRIVGDNGWPDVSKSITLLEGRTVLQAVENHVGMGSRKTSYTNAFRIYRLSDHMYIDISN